MNTTHNPFSLTDRVILVTGASSGIGKAIAIECSKMGAKVIITGRNEERLQNTFEQMEGTGHKSIAFDLNQDEQIIQLLKEIPQLDGIVHSAGIVRTLPFHFINRHELQSVFDINFMLPVLLSKEIIKAKKTNKGCSIVFISSIDGPIISHIGNSLYASSKGAVNAMVKGMALELAHKKIRVNCVMPGMIRTPMILTDEITTEQIELEEKRYPLKRFGEPEEVAYAVIYLLSNASAWITGSGITIDGGYTLI